MSTITVIFNPASGSAGDTDELRAAFDAHADGLDIRWSPTTAEDPGFGQTRAAIAQGSAAVVACGGDGTVRAVAQELAGSRAALGVVPLGTGNLLAGNLGVPSGLDAVPVALTAHARRIDAGVVNGERFAVMAGVGFDAMMIRDADPAVKRRLGSVAYVLSGARNVPARIVRARLTIDGEPAWAGRTAMVLVGNCGAVTGGLEVFPDALPDDGVLDVAVLTAETMRDWVRVAWRLVRGRSQPAHLVRRFRARSLVVELDRSLPYELDGEDRPPTDRLEFDVEHLALDVRCP